MPLIAIYFPPPETVKEAGLFAFTHPILHGFGLTIGDSNLPVQVDDVLCLVIPGAAYPMHLYPGHIEGVWGQVGTFSFMPAEMLLSLGILAIVGLLFVLGLKFLQLLPEKGPEDKVEEAPAAEEEPVAEEPEKGTVAEA